MTNGFDKSADNQSEARISVACNKYTNNCHWWQVLWNPPLVSWLGVWCCNLWSSVWQSLSNWLYDTSWIVLNQLIVHQSQLRMNSSGTPNSFSLLLCFYSDPEETSATWSCWQSLGKRSDPSVKPAYNKPVSIYHFEQVLWNRFQSIVHDFFQSCLAESIDKPFYHQSEGLPVGTTRSWLRQEPAKRSDLGLNRKTCL